MSSHKSHPALHALRETLSAPSTEHLNDGQLAELATAEAAGESLESAYPQETAHLETCVACAEAYTELIMLMEQALEGMAAAPEPISPPQGYTTLLLQKLRQRLGDLPGLFDLAQTLTATLPSYFPHAPAETDFNAALLQQLPALPDLAPETLLTTLRETRRALAFYLEGLANTLWGTPARLASETVQAWVNLHLTLTPQPVMPILGETKTTSPDWILAGTRAGHPLPLNITLRARRLSPLACRVEVSVDRPGLLDPSGRTVELHYAGQNLVTRTDATGLAIFYPVPIAVLPELALRFQS
ncbi:MAG: hypothetical protein H6636_04570 [Anaerolineales bacterium]|nr:hypothetical protein [Anaerolineales bacterium]